MMKYLWRLANIQTLIEGGTAPYRYTEQVCPYVDEPGASSMVGPS